MQIAKRKSTLAKGISLVEIRLFFNIFFGTFSWWLCWVDSYFYVKLFTSEVIL